MANLRCVQPPSIFADPSGSSSSSIQTHPFPTFRRYLLLHRYLPPCIPNSPSSANPNAPPPVPIPPQPPTLLSALRSLFLHISKNPADKGTVAPRAFIDKLKELNELFRPSMHQDAHEFLNYVLNQIIEEMEADGQKPAPHPNGVEKSGEDLSTSIATLSTQPAASTSTAQGTQFHSTIVHRLFEGVLTSETRCLTCETVSSRDESFIDLSIDIEQNSSVTACLRQFSASEMLCQKNKFFCDSCCDLQEAEKRMKIKKLPNILALHLKRFKIQEDVGKYIKLAYRVAFPIELRLFNTVDDAEDPDRLYELFAIVVHIGNGPYHGHYVTIVKTRGAWTLFDDDTVSTVKEADIPKYFGDSNSGSAYVLYYQAVDLDLPALGLKSPTPPLDPATAADITYVPVPVSLATAEPSELSHAPSSPFLHKPPGLNPSVDDLNVSDLSESPMLTPGTAPLMSSNHNTSDSLPVAAPTPLYPHMHIPDEPLIPSPSSPTHKEHGSRTLGKALRSLRHPPSLRLKTPNGHKNDYQRSSTVDSHGGIIPPLPASPRTRRPQTTGSTATASTADNSTHDTIPSVPPSPVPPKAFPFPNGSHSSTKDKERTPEKKSNGWFRRKSTRAETGPLTPASPRLTRRGSEAAMSDAYSPVVPPTPLPPLASTAHTEPPLSPSAHKKAVPDVAKSLRREKRGSTNPSSKLPPRPSTAGAEMTSSSRGFGSSSIGMPPPLPPLPASPPSPPPAHRTQAADVFPALVPPQGKGTEKGGHGTPDGGSPLRPSRPLPLPLPLPNGDPAEWELRPNRQAQPTPPPVRISHSDSQYSSSTTTYHSHHSHRTLPHPPRHSHAETAPPPPLAAVAALSFGRTGGGGVGDTPVVVSPATAQPDGGGGGAGPGPGPGHNWRRATRKLSFTAPILGFGRKVERKGPPPPPPPPPSSYAR
ncbi:cysteine proteinase [Ganoderma leucocontextum]|nr:cysteine proteinase [Ganoderma leucocontextum]